MRSIKNQLGQGMTEYIILVALIALAAIAAVKFFGQETEEGFRKAGKQLGEVNEGIGKGLGTAKE